MVTGIIQATRTLFIRLALSLLTTLLGGVAQATIETINFDGDDFNVHTDHGTEFPRPILNPLSPGDPGVLAFDGVLEDDNRTSIASAGWIYPKFESMTCGFDQVAGCLIEETPCEATTGILRTDSKLMWTFDQFRMEVMFNSWNFKGA